MKRIWLTLTLLLWPMLASAQYFPEYSTTTVNDFAALLPEAEEAALVTQLETLRKDTGVEMTVVTLTRQSTYAPDMSMEAFATGLFNEWGVGDKTKNNGIMVLILHEDRAMRLELGAGYAKDWDAVAQRVIDRSFLPSFKDNNYIRGITIGVTDTIDTIAKPALAGEEPPKKSNDNWFIFAAMAVVGGFFAFGRKISDFVTRLKTCPSCGQRGGLRRTRRVVSRATKAASGSGLKTTTCTNCSYHDETPYTISRLSSSSGRSSFGGGSSSGGGASGRW